MTVIITCFPPRPPLVKRPLRPLTPRAPAVCYGRISLPGHRPSSLAESLSGRPRPHIRVPSAYSWTRISPRASTLCNAPFPLACARPRGSENGSPITLPELRAPRTATLRLAIIAPHHSWKNGITIHLDVKLLTQGRQRASLPRWRAVLLYEHTFSKNFPSLFNPLFCDLTSFNFSPLILRQLFLYSPIPQKFYIKLNFTFLVLQMEHTPFLLVPIYYVLFFQR